MQQLSPEHRKGICQIIQMIHSMSLNAKEESDEQKIADTMLILGMMDAVGFLFPEFYKRLEPAQKAATTDFDALKGSVTVFIEWAKENGI